MLIIGIHDGHNATAALLKDGEIVAAISEERLSRIKNDPGYPKRAVDKVLEISNLSAGDIDYVALATNFLHPREFYQSWDWYKKSYDDQISEEQTSNQKEQYFTKRLRERKATIIKHLGISEDKIKVVEHHLAHASAAYYGSGFGEDALVLTLDGSGDGVCATVNVIKNSKIKRIAETPNSASIGKIYSRITYLLGMKPWEHEFKITGLAPYADKEGVKKSYDIIKTLIRIDNASLEFKNAGLSTNYCYSFLHKNLENHRFDWIAGAIQQLTEEVVIKWVKNAMKHTGKKKIVCGGGVFMNVKVNMLLCDIVDDLFVFPSCGDESLAIGAAYNVYPGFNGNTKTHALDNIYIGNETTDDDIFVCHPNQVGLFTEYTDDGNSEIARLLASGEIVARFNGQMEWGARALGNRSILANPSDINKVKELNTMIKRRDFWMPFTPTILYERQHDYLINPKCIESPYMLIAFRTTELAKKELAAAIHPYDYTVRPQILKREANTSYYDLIKKFEELTGIGAVLNTSFNIHGEPIVCSLEDAISTFKRSGLNFLAIGNYLIEKK